MYRNIDIFLCRVCMSGDVKCQEDLVLNASGICGKVAVEEKVVIPRYCGIFKGDGGGVCHTVA